MFGFDTAGVVAVYLVLGIGTARLAASATRRKFNLVVLLAWPVLLFFAAAIGTPDE